MNISTRTIAQPAGGYTFPMTDLQKAYLVGRQTDLELGGVSIHFYYEVDAVDLDLPRLEAAWNALVIRHPALRTLILPEGVHQVLESVPGYRIPCLDLSDESAEAAQQRLDQLRDYRSHRILKLDRWPSFDLQATTLPDGRTRIHLSIDGILIDGRSRRKLFIEWGRLYRDPTLELPPIKHTFRDFIRAYEAHKASDEYRAAREYWLERSARLPGPPELPARQDSSRSAPIRVARYVRALDPEQSARFDARADRERLSPTIILLTVFTEVLGYWSTSPRFTLNMTLRDRVGRRPEFEDAYGDYTSNMLHAVAAGGEGSFLERCRSSLAALRQDLKHSSFNGVQLVRELRRQGGSPLAPGYPVVFTSMLSKDVVGADTFPWLGERVFMLTQTPQVTMDFRMYMQDERLQVDWDLVPDAFPAEFPGQMADTLLRHLQLLADESDAWNMSSAEIAERIAPPLPNTTGKGIAAARTDHTLAQLVRTQLETSSDLPAVIADGMSLSYAQLGAHAGGLAQRLRELGAARETVVAVALRKGWQQMIATLGISWSGAAYLPLDPDQPSERLRDLLEIAKVRLVVTSKALSDDINFPGDIELLDMEDPQLALASGAVSLPAPGPADLAYLIYTSGSTGNPKGVMIEHGAAANTIVSINNMFGVDHRDRVLALSPLGFDLSVYDIFGPLSGGGAIVVPPSGAAPEPALWAELLERHQVTIWNSTPELMALLVDYLGRAGKPLPGSLRLVLLSGDWIPLSLPDRIHALGPTVEVISLGGATEGSIWSIAYPVQRVDPAWPSIPYGRALPGQTIQVLGSDLRPRPCWAVGEIAIGGKGVARGYWGDEQLTARKFVTTPSGERVYLTGDLGRLRADGNVEILGRKDFQLKIRGYRVEPGEIEAAITRHPAVEAALVMATEDGHRRLRAYVVPRNKGTLHPAELRTFLEERLPDYMVPKFLTLLDRFPLNANGKIDRRALPGPAEDAAPTAPATTTDLDPGPRDRVLELVRNLLDMPTIDIDDDLLDHGADSLDTMRLGIEIENAFGVRLPIDQLYREPTVRAIATLCAPALSSATQADQAPPPKPLAPCEKEALRDSQPGIRKDLEQGLALPGVGIWNSRRARRTATRRTSTRHFAQHPLPHRTLARLLLPMRQWQTDAGPKLRYASAGGLYPVQMYLYVKPDRISGLPGGFYYYHPGRHALMPITGNTPLAPVREAFGNANNRKIFDRAAFAVLLVADMDAITPAYGEQGWPYALVESGEMSQLLDDTVAGTPLGLCQIGNVNLDKLRGAFRLHERHRMTNTLVGGIAAPTPTDGVRDTPAESVDLLTCVGDDGNGDPVLLLPGAGGFHANLLQLAERLAKRNPVYVARFPGHFDGEEPVSSVELLAPRIAQAIGAVLAGRTLRLLGFSFGGVVALELAKILRSNGASVTKVALIDSVIPKYLSDHPEKARSLIDPLLAKVEGATDNTSGQIPDHATLLKSTRAYLEAHAAYQPTPHEGELLVLFAEDDPDTRGHRAEDWQPYATGEVLEIPVAGDKKSKFKHRELSRLVDRLNQVLGGRD